MSEGHLVVTEQARKTDKVENSGGRVQHKFPLCEKKFQWRHHMQLHMRVHRRAVQVKGEPGRPISADSVSNHGAVHSVGEAKGAKINKGVVACAFPPCEYKTKVACNMQRRVLRYHEPKKGSAPTPMSKRSRCPCQKECSNAHFVLTRAACDPMLHATLRSTRS